MHQMDFTGDERKKELKYQIKQLEEKFNFFYVMYT